jgi:chromosome segregation protein
MKISYLKIEGFRGIRNSIEIEFPPGFTIICGPNGAGKSTVCDAIEFGISGLLRQTAVRTERGETIRDYTWWRGKNPAEHHYVEVGINDENGKFHKFRRSKGERISDNNQKLIGLLCDPEYLISDALLQLCRTTILRDEEIPLLSLDLKETERFDFARNAIGIGSFGELEQKGSILFKSIKDRADSIQRNYEQVRSRVSDLTMRISEIKAEALGLEDIQKAETNIRTILNLSNDFRSLNLIDLATRRLAELNIRMDSLIRISKNIDEINGRKKEIKSKEFSLRLETARNKVEKIKKEIDSDKSKLAEIDRLIEDSQKRKPQVVSLAQLYEHGKQLGLRNGRCPLCNSKISSGEYQDHLHILSDEITKASAESVELAARQSEINNKKSKGNFELEKINREISYLEQSENALNEEKRNLLSEASEHGVSVLKESELTNEFVKSEIELLRNSLIALDKSITTIRVSKLYEKLPDLQDQLAIAKEESDKLSRRIQEYNNKINKIKEDMDTTKRIAGEIVDERLSELHPLLSELYYRLRPHKDWQTLNYYLRGDVRRMLSLEVGEGLNPNFIFSSGQRRAVALAFLISIHLARPWCKLNSLVLDDPIQHIDDYRALHFTEVLSSIRMLGRQVICTIEDAALAHLLTRRLRSKLGEEGKIINLAYSSGEGISIESEEMVLPFAKSVLLNKKDVG